MALIRGFTRTMPKKDPANEHKLRGHLSQVEQINHEIFFSRETVYLNGPESCIGENYAKKGLKMSTIYAATFIKSNNEAMSYLFYARPFFKTTLSMILKWLMS